MSDLVEVTYRQLTECSRLSRRMGPSTRLFAFLLAHVTKSTNAGQDEGFWTWIAMTNWRPPSPPRAHPRKARGSSPKFTGAAHRQ